MRTILFVVPYPAEASLRFARAYSELKGVRLVGVVQKRPTGAGAQPFADFIHVKDAFDVAQLVAAGDEARRRYGGIHTIVGVLEPLQVPLAEARRHFGIPGTDPRTADLFRDKARMKDALRTAGLPCARHKLITSEKDALNFVKQVGFPVVLKPPAGAGCKATWRIDNLEQLKGALQAVQVRPDNPTLAEEFLRGREYCFDTLVVDGKVRFENVSRYLPGPLEVTENPWIQWAVIQPRVMGPDLEDAREMGRKAIRALGLKAGAFTHMEWFRRDDGSLAIGEIAARPPGANFVEMMGFGHDADMYKAWARAVADNAFDGPYPRKYAVGCAYLRGMGHGRVQRISGVAEANRKVGHLAVKSRLPKVGQPKSDHYEGEGYVILRHPDTGVVAAAVKTVIETIRIEYA
ncbi:MAG: ATP-grasp domain-containing protein [Deltaproteobacteria bacterium]|nr:ATP-grasp domain-containing protein [Deltaproteobacteria bacterium]